MTALDRLIVHCSEAYPHFESPRGQRDIKDALAEHAALLASDPALDRLARRQARAYASNSEAYRKGKNFVDAFFPL